LPHRTNNIHEDNLGLLMARVCRVIGGEMRTKLERLGLYHAQGMILFCLWREDGLTQQLLAERLHIATSTVSNTLKRMERDGWVKRHRDEQDQRIVRVCLTERSRQLKKEAHASFAEMDRELSAILTTDEREILKRSLLKVSDYLTGSCPDAENAGCLASYKETGGTAA